MATQPDCSKFCRLCGPWYRYRPLNAGAWEIAKNIVYSHWQIMLDPRTSLDLLTKVQ
jgi:hypothetical protein